jgi:thymidylate synthase
MQQYLDLLNKILTKGEPHEDRTGVGTLSLFGEQIRFDLLEGFPLMTTKKLPFRWIAEELFWFLRGSTNEHELEAVGVDIWKEWATKEACEKFNREPGNLGPVYGELWRSFPVGMRAAEIANFKEGQYLHINLIHSVDQIEWLLNEIYNNPFSRRLIVSGWHPFYQNQVALPPCHTLWQIKIHAQKYMSLHLYARSIDSFLGLPFNIASYALLLTLIAVSTGYEPKELIISFGDVHIYRNHFTQVREQLTRRPKTLPDLEIRRREEDEDAFWTPLLRLLAFKYNDLNLMGYDAYPTIKAPVAI